MAGAAKPSIKVTKSFTYRGSARLWSNRYYFDGTTPPDSAHWTTFSDAVVSAEKNCYGGNVTVVETQGYDAGSEVPVFSKVYSTVGSLTTTGGSQSPGDAALMIRWSTASRTSKNHPLYLYNYYHGVYANTASNGDVPLIAQPTALVTFATTFIGGISDGAVTHHRCGPNGQLATGSTVPAVVRHRDFLN